jgi:hypothetical protein
MPLVVSTVAALAIAVAGRVVVDTPAVTMAERTADPTVVAVQVAMVRMEADSET